MAAFKGFGFTSSAELAAAHAAQFQAAMASGNPDTMRAAMVQQAANSLTGGPPDVQRARKVEDTLQKANEAAKNAVPEGADPMDSQMEYFKQIQRMAIDNGLPEIATQATAQLSELVVAKEQRKYLKQDSDIKAETHEQVSKSRNLKQQMDEIEYQNKKDFVVVDQSMNKVMHGDYTDLASDAEARAMMEADPKLQRMTLDEYFRANENQKDRLARLEQGRLASRSGGTIEKRGLHKQFQNEYTFVSTVDQLVDTLTSANSIDAVTLGNKLRGSVSNLGLQARSVLRGRSGDSREEAETHEKMVIQGNSRFQALRADQQGLAMDLAYALATSREGGRLTDQDVERAAMTLGLADSEGGLDPRALAFTIGRVLTRRGEQLEKAPMLLGLEDDGEIMKAHGEVMGRYTDLLDRLGGSYDIGKDQKGDLTAEQFENTIMGRPDSIEGRNDPTTRPGSSGSPKLAPLPTGVTSTIRVR